MISVPPEVEDRLNAIARRAGRTKDDCAMEALLDFIETQEDYEIAAERLKRNEPSIPLEDVKRRLGLED